MREKFLAALHADPEAYFREYQRRFGNVLNADYAATLFDDYNASPVNLRAAVHPQPLRSETLCLRESSRRRLRPPETLWFSRREETVRARPRL